MANWKVMDKCAKQAQIAYPDNSAEANAKRDAKLKECLSLNNLAPREPMRRSRPADPAGRLTRRDLLPTHPPSPAGPVCGRAPCEQFGSKSVEKSKLGFETDVDGWR